MSGQPCREDFPDHGAYLRAWYTWRALQRDGQLTDAEREARLEVAEAHVRHLFKETPCP